MMMTPHGWGTPFAVLPSKSRSRMVSPTCLRCNALMMCLPAKIPISNENRAAMAERNITYWNIPARGDQCF